MEIRVPLLREQIGLGDLAKKAIEQAGVKQKQDCGCRKRQELMNQALRLVPK